MEEIGIFDYQPQHQETSSTSRAQISGPGAVDNDEDKDLYIKFKKLQRQLEFLQVGEENNVDNPKQENSQVTDCLDKLTILLEVYYCLGNIVYL